MERETGIEPATNSLEGCDSTIELLPRLEVNLYYSNRSSLLIAYSRSALDLKSSSSRSIESMKTILLVAALLPALAAGCFAESHPSPFACDRAALNAQERKRHFDELGPQLRTLVKQVRELADGFEFEFPSDRPSYQLVSEWAAGEHLCCPFFDIDLRLEREGGAFWLRLNGRAGTKEFIKADFSRWFSSVR